MLSWVVNYLGHLFQGESLFRLETILAVSIPVGICVFPCLFFVVGIWEE